MAYVILKKEVKQVKFETLVELDPKNPEGNHIMSSVQETQVMFLNILNQIDGFKNEAGLCLRLTPLRFDRFASRLAEVEILRTKMKIEVYLPGRSDSTLIFFHMRPDVPGENNTWFLSSDGENLDTPTEIFHGFLQRFRDEVLFYQLS